MSICTPVIEAGMAWKIRITSLSNNHWIFLGITGGASTDESKIFTCLTSYGWAGEGMVYVGGRAQEKIPFEQGGWSGFHVGDECIFKFVPVPSPHLRMRCSRTESTFGVPIPDKTSSWHIAVGLYGKGDEAELIPLDSSDLGCL